MTHTKKAHMTQLILAVQKIPIQLPKKTHTKTIFIHFYPMVKKSMGV